MSLSPGAHRGADRKRKMGHAACGIQDGTHGDNDAVPSPRWRKPSPGLRAQVMVRRVGPQTGTPRIPIHYVERYDLGALATALTILESTQQPRLVALCQQWGHLRRGSHQGVRERLQTVVRRMQRAELCYRWFVSVANEIMRDGVCVPVPRGQPTQATRTIAYVRKRLPDGRELGRCYAQCNERVECEAWALFQSPNGSDSKVARNIAYQGGMREARRVLARCYYHDIDIKNAFPTIARKLAADHGVAVEALDEYSSDRREGILKEVMQHYCLTDRDDAKTLFLSLLHGGMPKGWMRRVGTPVRTLHPFVRRFVGDIERLVPAVLRDPVGKGISAHREAIASDKGKKLTADEGIAEIDRTLFADTIQTHEHRILCCIVDSLQKNGWVVGSLQFDGVYVEHRDDAELTVAMRAAEEAVFVGTQFRIQLTEKELYQADIESILDDWRTAHVAS